MVSPLTRAIQTAMLTIDQVRYVRIRSEDWMIVPHMWMLHTFLVQFKSIRNLAYIPQSEGKGVPHQPCRESPSSPTQMCGEGPALVCFIMGSKTEGRPPQGFHNCWVFRVCCAQRCGAEFKPTFASWQKGCARSTGFHRSVVLLFAGSPHQTFVGRLFPQIVVFLRLCAHRTSTLAQGLSCFRVVFFLPERRM